MSYGPEDFCEHGDIHKLCGICAELTQLRALRDAVKAWGVARRELEAARKASHEATLNDHPDAAIRATVYLEASALAGNLRAAVARLADGLAGEEGEPCASK